MNAEILTNIYATIQAFWEPIRVGGILFGYILLGVGLYRLAKPKGGQAEKGVVAGCLLGGLLLINTGAVLALFSRSLLGVDGGDFTFGASVAGGPGQDYMKAAVAAIKMIGAFGFARGCYLLGRSGSDGQGAVWAGLIHIVGAVLALNVEVFAVMVGDTLGGTFGQTIRSLFN